MLGYLGDTETLQPLWHLKLLRPTVRHSYVGNEFRATEHIICLLVFSSFAFLLPRASFKQRYFYSSCVPMSPSSLAGAFSNRRGRGGGLDSQLMKDFFVSSQKYLISAVENMGT